VRDVRKNLYCFNFLFFCFLYFLELPYTRPSLKADFHHYEAGDILKANCSSTAARPKVELVLTINNMVVSENKKNCKRKQFSRKKNKL
jgi:hypothetical protein